MPHRPSAPSTPHRQPRLTQNNFLFALEIPAEIARTTQLSFSLTPHSTPVGPAATEDDVPETPDSSPIRPARIPSLNFDPVSPQPRSREHIFNDVTPRPSRSRAGASAVGDPFTATPPPSQPCPRSTPNLSQSRSSASALGDQFAEAPPPSQPRSRASTYDDVHVETPIQSPTRLVRTETSGQYGIPILDNQVHELDPSWPEPVYPCDSELSPLPNIPLYPKKYYIIFRGLKIGVFYNKW